MRSLSPWSLEYKIVNCSITDIGMPGDYPLPLSIIWMWLAAWIRARFKALSFILDLDMYFRSAAATTY